MKTQALPDQHTSALAYTVRIAIYEAKALLKKLPKESTELLMANGATFSLFSAIRGLEECLEAYELDFTHDSPKIAPVAYGYLHLMASIHKMRHEIEMESIK